MEQADGVLVGVARGVDASGHLVLRSDDGTDLTVAVGDVVHLRDEKIR